MVKSSKSNGQIRKKIYMIVEGPHTASVWSNVYDCVMIFVIVLSLIPLAFKTGSVAFTVIDWACVSIFIVDYILRLITADYKYGKKSAFSFIRYPFTPLALIDLLSILPTFSVLSPGFRILRLFRMMRALRVLRALKAIRYSRNLSIIITVFKKQKVSLTAVWTLAIGYILIASLVIFNVEPDSFHNFFDAIYWATVSLTTVGYGDIYPVTVIGKVVAMISSIFGIAIIALPSGIITAGFMRELNADKSEDDETSDQK